MEEDRVQATPDALEVIERLAAEHGPLVFLQSGGCCDGSSPVCVRRADSLVGPNDVLLGEVGIRRLLHGPRAVRALGAAPLRDRHLARCR